MLADPTALAVARPVRAWILVCAFTLALCQAAAVHAQIKAQVRPATPAWSKGLQPIGPESYYNAIECGKQGGADPACVFWDTDMCKNDAFDLRWYSAYKQVAYEVWTAVQKKLPAPQPSYSSAQRTRITIALTPAKGSKSNLKDFVVKRGGKPVATTERALSAGGGRFGFDYPAFAPGAAVTLEMVAQDKTVSCTISPAVLRRLR